MKEKTPNKKKSYVLPEECFDVCNKVTSVNMDVIKVSNIPQEGDIVYTEGNVELKIMDEIGHGGEGHVYFTNSPFLAKIYKSENITNRIKGKIEKMLQRRIECDGICYPVAALYNSQKEFVGYLMPLAKGKELQKCVFMPKLLSKNFPKWKKRDLVELTITILEKIKYLHDRNIIIGDINPNNILVVSSKEVYIVDTDSFQIEDFPCPVGTVNFTAPEIQKQHFGGFLRSKGNENFAVATLLFMLMLPGKPPYAQQGGEDPVSNIIKMDFSYPFGGESNKKAPDGPWRYMWSHLPYYVKEVFYKTFRAGEEFSSADKRPSVDKWIDIFSRYLSDLDSGNMAKNDSMSEELFPVRTKKWDSNLNVINCKVCNKEEIEELCRGGICQSCMRKMSNFVCHKCNKKFKVPLSKYLLYTQGKIAAPDMCPDCESKWTERFCYRCRSTFWCKNDTIAWHQRQGWALPDVCPDCLKRITTIRCCDCGSVFTIKEGTYYSFRNKGFDMPKRCERCRNNRRQW